MFFFQPAAVATARIMGPIQISAGANPGLMPGDPRMQFQNTMGAMPRMVSLTFIQAESFFFYYILLFRYLMLIQDQQCRFVFLHH